LLSRERRGKNIIDNFDKEERKRDRERKREREK